MLPRSLNYRNPDHSHVHLLASGSEPILVVSTAANIYILYICCRLPPCIRFVLHIQRATVKYTILTSCKSCKATCIKVIGHACVVHSALHNIPVVDRNSTPNAAYISRSSSTPDILQRELLACLPPAPSVGLFSHKIPRPRPPLSQALGIRTSIITYLWARSRSPKNEYT